MPRHVPMRPAMMIDMRIARFQRLMPALALAIFSLLLAAPRVHAVEVAPRISDREIIEALAQLREGQKALNDKIDAQSALMDQRFEAVDQRFEAVDQRFEQLDKRLDDLWSLMLVMLAGSIFGLIGFVVWDRKTALKPLEQRMARLEQELHAELQAHHGEDSELQRLLKALRAFAAEDERLAKVLRQFCLL